MSKLDLKDRKILFELDYNSRQPNSIIAKKISSVVQKNVYNEPSIVSVKNLQFEKNKRENFE